MRDGEGRQDQISCTSAQAALPPTSELGGRASWRQRPWTARQHTADALLPQLVIAPAAHTAAQQSGRRQRKRNSKRRLPEGFAQSDLAPNLFACSIDVAKLSLIRTIAASLVSALRRGAKLEFKPKRFTFYAEHPNWKSDIQWVSKKKLFANDKMRITPCSSRLDNPRVPATRRVSSTMFCLHVYTQYVHICLSV